MAGLLNAKVAIITGGVSGIGLGGVKRFVEEGGRVVVADVQDNKGAELEAQYPGAVRYAHCDIRSEEHFQSAVDLAISEFGGLDVMYHNAAVVGDKSSVDKITVEGWDDTLAMLLRSTMLAIKVSVEPMKARGKGSIILTSSAAATRLGGSGPYAYTVGKAGVISAGQFAALELGQYRIRVNTLVPGGFRTSIWSGHVGGDAKMGDQMGMDADHFAKMQALPFAGETRHIADAAVYLASELSDFVTGVVLPVDGGLTLHRNQYASAAGQLGAVTQAVSKLER